VDKLPVPPPAVKPPRNGSQEEPSSPKPEDKEEVNQENVAKLRYLLARRLVREDRYAEAAAYMPAPYDKVLQKYAAELRDGANEKLPKTQRARAWFGAAWLARYDGMELMGTEVAPDSFITGGDFTSSDLAKDLISGTSTKTTWSDGNQKTEVVKNALPTPKKELGRLKSNVISPDIRFHYRLIAGALAMKAAALLKDNTEELADVINKAGQWVKKTQEKTADHYYEIFEKRCPKTVMGQKVLPQHWFTEDDGPWSTEERTAWEARNKETGAHSTE